MKIKRSIFLAMLITSLNTFATDRINCIGEKTSSSGEKSTHDIVVGVLSSKLVNGCPQVVTTETHGGIHTTDGQNYRLAIKYIYNLTKAELIYNFKGRDHSLFNRNIPIDPKDHLIIKERHECKYFGIDAEYPRLVCELTES